MSTDKQEVATENTATEDKVFTQEEVNGIVADRLRRERDKYTDYDSLKEKAEKFDAMEEANKTELQKVTDKAAALQKELDDIKTKEAIRKIREEVAKETGVPASLLTGSTEDDCREQALSIMDFAKPSQYPSVNDGGEAMNTGGKKATRDQFAAWVNQTKK